MSRRINLLWVNVVLWLVIVVTAVLYRAPLRWAIGAFPTYVDGSIVSPVERVLYVRASRFIRELDAPDERAAAMLRRSIEIDPHGEGTFWLGRYYHKRGRYDEALAAFEEYLEIDPTKVGAYLAIADLHRREGRLDEAQAILSAGIAYFERASEQLQPRPAPGVESRFNDKAVEVHRQQLRSERALRARLAELR